MIIKSLSYDQNEILRWIVDLYCPSGIDVDLTFGNGGFYGESGIKLPKVASFDIQPLKDFVIQASSVSTPMSSVSVESVMFDPPFLTYIKAGRDHNSIMSKRFSGYWTYQELTDHYVGTLKESSRILKKNGIMIFKCQDIIHNHKMHCTHYNVIEWAKNYSLVLEDLFILGAKHRLPNAQRKRQLHARIYHSYFLVFRKHLPRNQKYSKEESL